MSTGKDVNAQIYTYACIYIYTSIHTQMSIYIHINIYIYVYIYIERERGSYTDIWSASSVFTKDLRRELTRLPSGSMGISLLGALAQ